MAINRTVIKTRDLSNPSCSGKVQFVKRAPETQEAQHFSHTYLYMEKTKLFTGNSEAEIWQQVAADMQQEGEILTYTALLNQNGQETLLNIDIDLGGGFESGFSTTMFRVKIPHPVFLQFNIHEQDLLNEVGKIFGMEDIKLGYPEFDAAFIVQTNQPETVRALFADEDIRHMLLKHPDAKLKLQADDDATGSWLEFTKEDAIVDPAELREVYHLLHCILGKVDINDQ